MNEKQYKHIWVATPGAPNGQGGIVRQANYLFQAWPEESSRKLHWLQTWNHQGCKPCVYMRALLKFTWARLRGRADLLHLNLASQGSFYRKYLLARLAKYLRVPFVVHLHGGGFREFYDESPKRQRERIEWLFYETHHCVVLGAGWQHFLELCFRMPYEKVTTVLNAVPDVAPAIKQNDVPHLLFLGHVMPRKGMDELILALAGLEELPWRATIAGSGQLAHYRAKVAEHGLQNRVRFTGWLDTQAVEKQYEHADILVLPSHIENQPLCLLEAMARGVAIITTNIGTIPELLRNGEHAMLVPPGDAVQLAKAIARLLDDEELREWLIKSARERYKEHHTLMQHVQKMQLIYQECLTW